MTKREKQRIRTLGTFQMPDGQKVAGDLHARPGKIKLVFHTHHELDDSREPIFIVGVLGDLRKVSCIDSIVARVSSRFRGESDQYYSTTVLPHFICIGDHYLNPASSCISSVIFKTQDTGIVFHDFHAFGNAFLDTRQINLLKEFNGSLGKIEFGEHPHFTFFRGKYEILVANTCLGEISAQHRPTYKSGGAVGNIVSNEINIKLSFDTPLDFNSCLDRLYSLNRFLTFAAGRPQAINNLKITITGHDNVISDKIKVPASLDIYMRHGPKRAKENFNIPHPGDLPLDPTRRPDEFRKVLANWFEREKDWRNARVRYVGCLEKGASYDVDRLVAAANMFDILPASAFLELPNLKLDLEEARDKCRLIFRKLSDSPERNSVLGALGRMHKPSLTSKVLQRTEIVINSFGMQFPDLKRGATTAIKLRNYFVHGNSGGLDYRRVESSFTFLTDLLEFVFAASDFITAGWDARTWTNTPHSAGHSFAAFRWSYRESMAFLLRSLEDDKDNVPSDANV